MELAIVAVILITSGALLGSALLPGFISTVIFVICFTGAGIFGGASFIHWLADTPAKDERMVPTLISIFFVCMCVLTVIVAGG